MVLLPDKSFRLGFSWEIGRSKSIEMSEFINDVRADGEFEIRVGDLAG
jgi:hypothetical protein